MVPDFPLLKFGTAQTVAYADHAAIAGDVDKVVGDDGVDLIHVVLLVGFKELVLP